MADTVDDRSEQAGEPLTSGGAIVSLPVETPLPLAATSPSVEREPPVGERIGRYQLVKQLGAGGMGVVWEARDPELGRRVAIKLVREGRHAKLADRLRREAQALAQLHHPNVIAVYDVGVADGGGLSNDGGLYIVMQLVAGRTLGGELARKDRPAAAIVDLFVQAGQGLAAAHTAGIVHRDFKPSNVLVDDDGNVRVSDFGLARAAEGTDEPLETATSLDDSITRGDLVGTPAYMAPEQFSNGPVTPATDQFSFCVALWEALAGKRPYAGTSVEELRAAVLAGRHGELPSSVPRRVRAVLARGLAVRPSERFASMDELLARLKPRRRALWIAGALGAAAAGTAVTFAATHTKAADPCAAIDDTALGSAWDPAVRQHLHDAFVHSGHGNAEDAFGRVAGAFDQYGRDWVAMRAESCRATFERGEQSPALFDRRVACLDASRAELGALAAVLAKEPKPGDVDRALDAVLHLAPLAACADHEQLLAEVPLPADPIVRARVQGLGERLAEAKAQNLTTRRDQASATLAQILPDIRAAGYAPLLANALDTDAEIEALGGDRAKAAQLYFEAADAAARGKADKLLAEIWTNLIRLYGQDRKADAAAAVEPFARAAVLRAGSDPLQLADLDHNMGVVLRVQGKHAEAEARLRAGLARLPESNRTERAQLLQALGNVQKETGDYKAAAASLEASERIDEQLYGPDGINVSIDLFGLARIYRAVGRCDDAKRAAARELAIGQKILGHDNHDLVLDYALQGEVAGVCFKDAAAVRAGYETAIAIADANHDNVHLASILPGYAYSLKLVGKPAEAVPVGQRGLAVAEATGDPVAIAAAAMLLAETEEGAGQAEASLALWQRAAELYRGLKVEVDYAQAQTGYGETLVELHRAAQAIAPLEISLEIAQRRDQPFVREIQTYLAEALWDGGGDRVRAVTLAKAARDAYAKDKAPPAELAAVTAWLAAHAPTSKIP